MIPIITLPIYHSNFRLGIYRGEASGGDLWADAISFECLRAGLGLSRPRRVFQIYYPLVRQEASYILYMVIAATPKAATRAY